jgi:uncharacterized low-complexity protein
MKKITLLASFSTALLVTVAGCASTPKPKETAPAAAAAAEDGAKPAEGSCGADKKLPADGAKAGEGSCGEGSCGAAPK